MSLLNISLLHESVTERKLTKPSLILDYVRNRVINALNPEGKEESKDGMDCSLCLFDFANNKLEAACANNPIWIARKGSNGYSMEEIKADKIPVGIHDGKTEKPFALNDVILHKGDIIYSLSDGYADQFGGPAGKKFKNKQLQEILLANAGKPMSEQRKILEDAFDSWKGSLEQTDDMLVIAIKV